MDNQTISLSTNSLDLRFEKQGKYLRLTAFAAHGRSWLHSESASGLFGVTVNGTRLDAANMEFTGMEEVHAERGIRHMVFSFQSPEVAVRQHLKLYEDTALLELCPVITNQGKNVIRVERVDSVALSLAAEDAELFSFTGSWGGEFEPLHSSLTGEVILESRSGRSSKGNHPWFALFAGEKKVLSGAVAWSGNWCFRFEPTTGGVRLSGGLHDWQFAKQLAPGETFEGAPVVLVLGDSLNAVSQQYAQVGRKHWYPRNALAERLPVEWNHWWPYEDAEINETVFASNAAAAEGMGIEVCTLDAGWFGPSDAGTYWVHYRGDWHLVNRDRFPDGLRPISDDVHARGMKFGIWCEIEGLGSHAQLVADHPEYAALRGGERIGCVCFGSPHVQEWAYQTLTGLITEYQADWIKLDFNLEPGAGCDREDHGHQAGDGLYEHIRGYYRTLERVRLDYPQVVLENCSSGGLRIDLGMLRRTDMTFLSDPDWPLHSLQVFWGASTMLAAERLLHWTFSHWRERTLLPQQNFDPRDPSLTLKKWDTYSRIAMLGWYGLSQRLPDLPEWLAKRITVNNQIYQKHVRRFVKEADLFRLNGQPLRSGEGEHWPAFQYSLPDGSEHLLFIFRLPGAEPQRAIHLENLQPDRWYTIDGLEGEFHQRMTGAALMQEGLLFSGLDEEESALLKIF